MKRWCTANGTLSYVPEEATEPGEEKIDTLLLQSLAEPLFRNKTGPWCSRKYCVS